MNASSPRRPETAYDRVAAVVRAIELMKAGLGETLSLTILARTGLFSPFHFHRVFSEVTGVTPARFLAALRMAEAKRMLLHSQTSVVDISVWVGYESPGTFSTQFSRLVGVAPGHFRQLARACAGQSVQALLSAVLQQQDDRVISTPRGSSRIALSGAPDVDAIVVGAVFPEGCLRERPGTWMVGVGQESVSAATVPGAGEYRACVIVVDPRACLVDTLVDQTPGSYLSGIARVRPEVAGQEPMRVALHPPHVTDPPLLAVTPLRWLDTQTPRRPVARRPGKQRKSEQLPDARPAGGGPSGHRRGDTDPAAQGRSRTVTVALAAA